ncbi:MAG: hypothetical protein ACRDBO_15090 [Lachnospiraceae bacterium]
MKKHLLVTAIMAMALTATACSKKPAEPVVTEPTTVETTEATTADPVDETEEGEDEDIEETYMTGFIMEISETTLTVENEEDQTVATYDITTAEITQEFPFAEGDLVEICYAEGTTADPIAAISVDVITSVIGESTDPYVEGTVEDVTKNTITIKLEDGESYTLNTSNAYIVGKKGIQNDATATVTFIGEIDDTDPIPLAVKVVMEDSYDTTDAGNFAFTGEVVQTDEESIVLRSADDDLYTFVSNEILFTQYEKGDTVQVFYTGPIMEKEIPAVSAQKK